MRFSAKVNRSELTKLTKLEKKLTDFFFSTILLINCRESCLSSTAIWIHCSCSAWPKMSLSGATGIRASIGLCRCAERGFCLVLSIEIYYISLILCIFWCNLLNYTSSSEKKILLPERFPNESTHYEYINRIRWVDTKLFPEIWWSCF